MTPQQVALLAAAKLECEGHQLIPADQREIGRPARQVPGNDGSANLPMEEAQSAEIRQRVTDYLG